MYYGPLTKRVGNTVRLAQVLQVFVKHGFADIVRRMGLTEGLPAKMLVSLRLMEAPSGEPATLGRRIRAAFTELGPTFIKFGQILSTRPDLIGQELATELNALQDRVEPTEFDVFQERFVESFGAPVETLYGEFNKEPIASASLSQVYRARLHSGEDVAVKVLRPGTRQTVESDLSLMRGVAEWIAEHVEEMEWIDPPGTVDEFARSVRREMDFDIEARVIERFRNNFRGDKRVITPDVFPELSNDKVLTMSWVDGVRVDALDKYPERKSEPREVAVVGCHVLCEQVFEHHFFHADPHPGNIMVTENNRIAFLDYGMVGHLERTDVIAMADLLRAVTHEDARACTRLLLSFTTTGEVEDELSLTHEIADYLSFEAQTVLAGGEVGKAIEHLTTLLRRNKLQLAPRFSMLLKALGTIESTGHALDDDLDMRPIIQPYAERIVMSRFQPRQMIEDFVTNTSFLLKMLRDVPSDVQNIVRALRRGRMRIQITHEGLHEFAQTTDRASNRISFSVIIASIIIGSSWLIASGAVPQYLSIGGYAIAGLLGLGLVISIIRSRNL